MYQAWEGEERIQNFDRKIWMEETTCKT